MRRRVWTWAIVAVLVAAALLKMSGTLDSPVHWTPDGLFYEARAMELEGTDRPTALARVFEGPLAGPLRAIDPSHTGDPEWVRHHAPFYDRRVSVPLAAAALDGVRGERALLDLSVAGYVAAVVALFLLLALRFHVAVAGGVALATVFLPALVHHSAFPQTDSWGLALEIAAFLSAFLVLTRGPRWLVAWVAAILLLSFTRDSMWVPILGAAAVGVLVRSGRALALAGTGLLATLPVLLAFPVPLRSLLATMLNGTRPVADPSWSFIVDRYPGAVVDKLHADGGFVLDGAWLSAAYLLTGVGLLLLLGSRRRQGEFALLLRCSAIAGAVYVLAVPIFSAFRLELALVPMAAFGLALGAERLAVAVPFLRSLTRPAATDPRPAPAHAGDMGGLR